MRNEIFRKNVEALSIHHPELVRLLGIAHDGRHLEVVEGRLRILREDGELMDAHGEDPGEAAQRAAALLRTGDPAQGEQTSFFLFGMGLGYLAKAIVPRLPERCALAVFEADPAIFRLAMHETDLTDLLTSNQVKLLVGEEARCEPVLYHCAVRLGRRLQFLRCRYIADHPVYERKLSQEIYPFIRTIATNIFTVAAFGRFMGHNILENLPAILGNPGAQALHNLFPQSPAICVAAGPSLAKNVHLLHEAKGKAVIICADASLRYLLEREIVPNFVVSVDPQEETAKKFQGFDIPPEVTLLFHPAVYPAIPRQFVRKFSTDTSMVPYLWLAKFIGPRGSIEEDCQCQMHLAWNLAACLGAHEIALIGQDLSYKDNYYVFSEEPGNRQIKTQDINGEDVYTQNVMLDYLHTFRRKLANHPERRTYQASEGGLPIPGAEVRTLAECLEDWQGAPEIDVREKVGRGQWAVGNGQMSEALLEAIRVKITEMEELACLAREIEISPEEADGRLDVLEEALSLLAVSPAVGERRCAWLAEEAGAFKEALEKLLESLTPSLVEV